MAPGYETHYTAQKRGQYRERSILRQLGQHFVERCLHEITREDVIEWRTRRSGGVTFHCLRHTGASRMLVEGGVDLETVRQIGGWSSYRMLQRYVHPTDAARRAAVEAIGNGKPTE